MITRPRCRCLLILLLLVLRTASAQDRELNLCPTPTCPDYTVALSPPEDYYGKTGDVVVVTARVDLEMAGCFDNAYFTYTSYQPSWEVVGIKALPQTGTSWRAQFTCLTPGAGKVIFHIKAPKIRKTSHFSCQDEKAVERQLYVLKVDLDVDHNRDREIKFTANDATSSDDKYRFWINNDCDSGDDDAAEDLDPFANAVDHSDSTIQCQRDLEDFSPLGFKIEAPNAVFDGIHAGAIEISLAFKDANGGPAIKLYEAVNTGGVFNYLDDASTAASQAGTAPYENSMGEVALGRPFVFPASSVDDLVRGLSISSPSLYLVFEGSGIGSAELVLRLKKSGVTICESAPVFIDLKDIKKMYEHYTLGDTVAMDAAVIPTTATEINEFSYTTSSPEEDDYILFIHGWRMLPWERRYFAETAYKRLFWVNYRGRFGLFSWPTEHCDPAWSEPGNYDRSEQKAWHSGAGFRNLLVKLDALYPDRVRVMAHSMGNIVASEALRHEAVSGSPNPIAHTYIASQSASVAHAYDAAGPTVVETDMSTGTPEVYAVYPQRAVPASAVFHLLLRESL